MKNINSIAVLTSGGDSPGMNAAIRAVVRSAIYYNLKVYGVYEGYKGLIENNICELKSSDVSNIIQRGGTILRTARCDEFKSPEGRQKAHQNLKEKGIDGLVVIGGDGTFTGAKFFSQETNIPVIGIPGTIDNDLYGTDYTIGYDTALNTVVEAVDKIRDTASAHNRLFFIEVMGRDAGFIALRSAIAVGAEAALLPEVKTHYEELKEFLLANNSHKKSSIIIVAEGERHGGAYNIAERVEKDHPEYNVRVSVLGHMQRGGSPSAFDRVMASRLGVSAVKALINGHSALMCGVLKNEDVLVPFKEAIKDTKQLNQALLDINKILTI
ncbi:6-phosphofructokinase [Marinilabiliaceae bacterium JC040]|nr:6-phosphofructokinase [Marinilabiliaceae bacterium JC040]